MVWCSISAIHSSACTSERHGSSCWDNKRGWLGVNIVGRREHYCDAARGGSELQGRRAKANVGRKSCRCDVVAVHRIVWRGVERLSELLLQVVHLLL